MKAGSILLIAGSCLAVACATAQGQPPQEQASQVDGEVKPFRGPIKPDRPLAKAYNDSAKALTMVDENPLIAWEYRVWCETGYRDPEDAGTGQEVDEPHDIARDYISPKGFFYHYTADRLMPDDGVRFLDNAWYFGADGLGVIVVQSEDGLLLFDTMGRPEHFQLIMSQMSQAGLDPADVSHVFITHYHWDHTGGINTLLDVAPNAKIVIGGPDGQLMMNAKKHVMADTMPETLVERKAVPFRSENPETAEAAAALKARRLAAFPKRFDVLVAADPGVKTGMEVIETGPSTSVTAMLAPGHTPGQTLYVVPVEHKGETRQLLVMGGNDLAEEAKQYGESSSFVRSIAGQLGADTLINTHGYQGAMYYHLRQIKENPDGPNPFAMGPDGVDRFLGVFAECHRATYNRMKDGTWIKF